MSAISDKQIADDIRRIADQLGTNRLSYSEYLQHGSFTVYQIYDGGRTWESLCQLVGIETKKIETIPDEIYFARLRVAVAQLGRIPKTTERKKYGLNFSKRRYPTLRVFVEKAILLGELDAAYSEKAMAPSSQVLNEREILEGPNNVALSRPQRPVPPIPRNTGRSKWERTGIHGFPYAPQDELGVVSLFAILCSEGIIDWEILELRGGKGIDATCFDHISQQEIRVELKHTHSRSNWNHKVEDIDYVVCWDNRWKDFPKPVISLRDIIRTRSQG